MAIRVGLAHTTEYSFDREVSLSPHIIRLRPAPHTRTPIESYSLKISPEDHFLNWQQDPFGNYLARIVFPNKSDYLKIEVNLVAKLTVINPFDFFIESGYEEYPFTYTEKLQKDLNAYLEITDNGPLLQDLLEQVDRSPQETNTFLVQVNRLVNQMLNYEIRMDPGVQSCEKTLTRKSGSCRDFSWLLVQVFRHLGIASRFVSGYSVQLAPDEKPLDGPAGVSQDVTDLHAWTEVYIPGAGWIGLDSTSGLMASEGHIPLACVPDFHNGAPIEGATDVCEVEFAFSNTVTRLKEDPRVTKPYSATQWEAIHELGKKVDKDLFEHDVRLTMGGEPTFVSIDDYESAQWNTRADGAHKRTLGWNLGLNLNKVIGKKGIIHHGQGKWYPGEPLPRWAYTLIWRKDGYPIWNDYNLLDAPFIQRDLTIDHAQSFIKLLSQYLNIHTEDDRHHQARAADLLRRTLDKAHEVDILGSWRCEGELENPNGIVILQAGELASGLARGDIRVERPSWLPSSSDDLRAFMKQKGWSASKTARMLGISPRSLQNVAQYTSERPISLNVRNAFRRMLWPGFNEPE